MESAPVSHTITRLRKRGVCIVWLLLAGDGGCGAVIEDDGDGLLVHGAVMAASGIDRFGKNHGLIPFEHDRNRRMPQRILFPELEMARIFAGLPMWREVYPLRIGGRNTDACPCISGL